MNPYNFAVLFFSFCTFFVSLLIWLKRHDSVGKSYFIFSIFVTIWGVGFSLMIGENIPYEAALFSIRAAHVGAILIPVTWLHFALIFIDRVAEHENLLKTFYAFSIFLEIFVFTPWFIPGLQELAGLRFGRVGLLYHVFTATFFTIVPLGFFQLFKRMRIVTGSEKLQLVGLILATLAGFIGGGLTFLGGYGINLPQYGLFLMPLYPFIIGYFMIRKNLFNLEEIAEAAQRAKLAAIGILATSINHEIRNPLYVIRGLAESHLANLEGNAYQNDQERIAKSKEVLSKSIEQAQRAMDIVKRFAAFAKQGTKEETQFEEVDLLAVFEGILPLVQHELELDKIRLTSDIPDDLPPIHADRRHMEEILFNLIVNACQAMKNGGQISVRAEQKNGSVQIEVEDQGSGIPRDRLSKIFEPFYTTKDTGTGLGLYITRQLVEKNRGKIKVESKLNKGTRFILNFPLGNGR